MNEKEDGNERSSKTSKQKTVFRLAAAGLILSILVAMLLVVTGCDEDEDEPERFYPFGPIETTLSTTAATTVSVATTAEETTLAPTEPMKQDYVSLEISDWGDAKKVFLLVRIEPQDGYEGEYLVTYDGQPTEYIESQGFYQIEADKLPEEDASYYAKLEWERTQ